MLAFSCLAVSASNVPFFDLKRPWKTTVDAGSESDLPFIKKKNYIKIIKDHRESKASLHQSLPSVLVKILASCLHDTMHGSPRPLKPATRFTLRVFW